MEERKNYVKRTQRDYSMSFKLNELPLMTKSRTIDIDFQCFIL